MKLGHDLFYGHVIGETVEDVLMVERLGRAEFGEISKDEKHLHAAKLPTLRTSRKRGLS